MKKSIFIAGASGGIGMALAKQAYEQGFDVIAAARDTQPLENLGYQLIEADFTELLDIQQMALEAAQFTSTIDLWAYTAGDILLARNWQMEAKDWQRIFDANLNGAQYALQACLPLLADDAHLFFLGAYTDRLVLPGMGAYAASKAALEAYTAVLEKELKGRRVTLVRPEAVDTPFWKKVPFKMPANALTPEEVAEQMLMVYEQGLSGLLDL
ncbi:MAG: SDR family NAD(P)-dependent oxidoreductase [Chloroflexi bacterium]|nr:SDR family NAD(P)-dependent oxidoreductase [Chloroflexota bacterium]